MNFSMAITVLVLALAIAPISAASVANVADKRIMKELRDIQESEGVKSGEFRVELVDDDIRQWYVYLVPKDETSKLYESFQEFEKNGGQDYLKLHVVFSDAYPFEPPFARIVSPLLGGGFVLPKGAICTRLLSIAGWSSAYSMESVFINLASFMRDGWVAGTISQEELSKVFNLKEAKEITLEAFDMHGWDRRHSKLNNQDANSVDVPATTPSIN